DRKAGWVQGGENGPVIVPGKPTESLLLTAIRYKDNDLRMPPNKKLPKHVLADFEKWIAMGAPDPRDAPMEVVAETSGPQGKSLEEGRKFWAFLPLVAPQPPTITDDAWADDELDRYVLSKIEERDLKPAPLADKATLLRRAYFDLTGLPPAVEQIETFLADDSPDAYAKVVDELLASPRFGERWGRHWLDVARYADTTGGGRNNPFPNAPSYREYVIESYNEDKPFDQFAKEQIAGDLLHSSIDEEYNENLTGTGFLALGPHNYELQDKALLRMEIVDEQLSAVGRAFLGVTMGCARCHDHPFDPIPTAEYYSLAGIFRSTNSSVPGNVAKFIERKLRDEYAVVRKKHEETQKELEKELKQAESKLKSLGGKSGSSKRTGKSLDPKKLEGIVVDDDAAKIVGEWISSTSISGYVGTRYIHDAAIGKGKKSVTFPVMIPKSGKYEVQLSYTMGTNRARKTPVMVMHDVGEEKVLVDQTKRPPILGSFISLGTFHFEEGKWDVVKITTGATSQVVIVDAIRLLPKNEQVPPALVEKEKPNPTKDELEKKKILAKAQKKEMEVLVGSLQRKMKEHKKDAPPKVGQVMSVREHEEAGDWHIHRRGGIRNLGPFVKRGFLAVATPEDQSPKPEIPEGSSGRLQLADWVASSRNPLTSRVYANRVWRHLFGRGIAPSPDNFGEMGRRPTHPELLDHLATSLVENGWSTKKLIRKVMLSKTYRMSSQGTPRAIEGDPENDLFSRQNRRRLEVEAIRDAMLVASGRLVSSGEGIDKKRSMFEKLDRNKIPEMFNVFDYPNPGLVSGNRNASTVPTQALFMMNSNFVLKEAKAAAVKILEMEGLDDRQRLVFAYKTTLGRIPSDGEKSLALAYLKKHGGSTDKQDAWGGILHGLFACLDFRYLN
ncbi:MAG: DUF1549 domain-containing protein, partial [Opitutae bacterium]|nr:DUF1549 domain-containing protein [Opitutae bacterium]